MVRTWGSVAVAAAMLLSSTAVAFGGTEAGKINSQQQQALAPGKAAGVKQAQMMSNDTWMIILGVGVVAGGIALAASGGGHGSVSTTTTGNP